MDMVAQIGPSIRIQGDITASEPLTIAGQVDGSIAVEGHPLTIVVGGRVNATLVAHTIVVAGEVSGLLNAGARIVVRETATIDGDLSAPAISLADGATLQGRVETTEHRRPALQIAS